MIFFLPITHEYLHINDSPVAVRKKRELGRERQMKIKCHDSKVQARCGEMELFFLLVRNG